MAFLASVQELTKAYGARPLFRDITLGIAEGERVGLIGPNGAGKSTLLKIFAGLEKPDSGSVAARRGLRMEYVGQEDRFEPGKSVEQVLRDALADRHLDEAEQEVQVSIMLARAGFPQPGQAVETLSGGWRKRLSLARALIREPELLLLDEPTNHLDLHAILWLEEILESPPFAFVVVTHDRYFLQNVTNRVIDLNPGYAEGYLSVNGPYTTFLERREHYFAGQAHQEEALKNAVRREIEWLGRTAEARSTKAQARIKQAYEKMDELSELRFRNNQERAAAIDFDATKRKTRELLSGHDLEKSLGGRTLFHGLNVTLSPGMKLGLIGANGSGKSTLIKILTDQLQPDRGTVRRADDLRVVLFDQNREQLDKKRSLRESLVPNGGDSVMYRGRQMHVAAWAKRFLFRPEILEMSIGYLSGGEQARIQLARMMLQPADLLILDEPTNDLDIPTLEVLEESLADFPGALVLVTHDRYLMDRLCTEILALDGRGGTHRFADYGQWERWQRRTQEAEEARKLAEARPAPAARPAQRLSMQEARELKRTEERIEKAEAEVEALKARMADPAVAADHVKLQAAWDEVQAAEARVAELYQRWEELEAKRGG